MFWAGGVFELYARGMPLGLFPGMEYEDKQTILKPGDSVLMYSDGLVEAHNPQGEMFGEEGLESCLAGRSLAGQPLIQLLMERQIGAGRRRDVCDVRTIIVIWEMMVGT